MIIFAFDLGSESSASACHEQVVRVYPGSSNAPGVCTCSSSTDAASIKPEERSAADTRRNVSPVLTIYPRYLRGLDHLE